MNPTVAVFAIVAVMAVLAIAILSRRSRQGAGAKLDGQAEFMGAKASFRADIKEPTGPAVVATRVAVRRDAELSGSTVALSDAEIGRDLKMGQVARSNDPKA